MKLKTIWTVAKEVSKAYAIFILGVSLLLVCFQFAEAIFGISIPDSVCSGLFIGVSATLASAPWVFVICCVCYGDSE